MSRTNPTVNRKRKRAAFRDTRGYASQFGAGRAGEAEEGPIFGAERSDGDIPANDTNGGGEASMDVDVRPSLTEAAKSFCSSCRDFGKLIFCTECGDGLCIAPKQGETGCLAGSTIHGEVATKFRCPKCIMKANDCAMPYYVIGYSGQAYRKTLWPLAIISITLSSSKERLLENAVELFLKNEYVHAPQNFYLHKILMRARSAQPKNLGKTIDFLEDSEVPPDVFVVLDTHSNAFGLLQHEGGATGGKSAPINEIITGFLGHDLLKAIGPEQKAANRVGFRGLLLMTCGPALSDPLHFKTTCSLVTNGLFDMVVGFSGASTIPHFVTSGLVKLITEIAVDRERNVWDALGRTMANDATLLKHSPVTVIYRDVNDKVISRAFGFHTPPVRVWGCDFSYCGTRECNPMPRDVYFKTKGSGEAQKVRQRCLKCGWKSDWKSIQDFDFLQQWDASHALVYWHNFPLTNQQQFAFGVKGNGGSAVQGETGGDGS